MDVLKLKECLTKHKRQELGIPLVLPCVGEKLSEILNWSLEGPPIEGRQIWFLASNAKEIRNGLAPAIRGRILPVDMSLFNSVLKRGPYDSLLLPKHGLEYGDPNLFLSPFWKSKGQYENCSEVSSPELCLWLWKSNRKPLRLFGIDHHHAVLWDVKKILRPLGVTFDFVWLHDGRAPVNEAFPSQIPEFSSSLDIYKAPPFKPLSEQTKNHILQGTYDGIVTSHSLVTCFRLMNVGLPMIHVNSTRFGNEWISDPEKHALLIKNIQTLLTTKQLHVVHNNQGDELYFHQYFPSVSPSQELWIPSLCENLGRLRIKAPSPTKIFIWDTRMTLLQPTGSPFMKTMYKTLKERFGNAVDSQAILLQEAKTYLGEGYLDTYTAVIHLPYNISTMSIFQQVAANIPIWVPTKRLLKELLADPKESNEMSWTVFSAGSEATASTMDQIRKPEVIKRWLECADFYKPDILPLVFEFDSLEDLVAKVMTTDYQRAMSKAEEKAFTHRENIAFAWELVLNGLKETA
jgi:hypothetical protein